MGLMAKTREQAKKIDMMIMTSMLLVLIVALVVLVDGFMEGSLAVIGIGCFFLGFITWGFYSY